MVWILIEVLKELSDKVTHIKGRLVDQTVILFNYVPFQNGNFSESKEFAPGANSFVKRAIPYGMENHFYHTGITPFYYARA